MKSKIALLTADVKNPRPNVGDFFITNGIEELFKGNELVRVPLHETPPGKTLELLSQQDLLVLCGSNLIGGSAQNGFRISFSLQQFQDLNKPVLGLGLGVQKDFGVPLTLSSYDQEFLRWIARSTHGVSARDALTEQTLRALLKDEKVFLTGCPSLFSRANLSARNRNLKIFCTPPYHYETKDFKRKNLKNFCQSLLQKYPSTLLAQEPSDLHWNLFAPGQNTFYHPLDPQSHLDLISAAAQILSFRIHPVLMGANHQVPSALIALDERTLALAKQYEIPTFRYHPSTRIEEVCTWYFKTLNNYPWERINEKLAESKENLQKFIEPWKQTEPRIQKSIPKKKLHIACLSDKDYYSQLLGLVYNLNQVCKEQEVTLNVFWLEETVPPLLEECPLKISFYSWQEVWGENFSKPRLKKNILAYLSKAAFLKKLVSILKEPVFFTDVDIYYFHSPAPLTERTEYALLFPHWNDQMGQNRTHGLFNSGMLAVTESALPFLDWWSILCQRVCKKNIQEGYYYEQGFLDMAPLYFPEIEIYREGKENCGVWNARSFVQKLDPLAPWQPRVNQEPMGSYHATHPDEEGFFTFKIFADQKALLISDTKSSTHIHTWILHGLARSWPEVKRLMFLYKTWVYRLGLPTFNLSEKVTTFLTVGKGELFLRALTYLYWIGKSLHRTKKKALKKLKVFSSGPFYELLRD